MDTIEIIEPEPSSLKLDGRRTVIIDNHYNLIVGTGLPISGGIAIAGTMARGT